MTLDTTTAEGRRALTEQHIKALQDAGCQMDAKSINTIFHVQRAAAINADRAERMVLIEERSRGVVLGHAAGRIAERRRIVSAIKALLATPSGKREWHNQGRSGETPVVDVHRVRDLLAHLPAISEPAEDDDRRGGGA